ncbi:hypothetical protein PC123_g13629 [Phytophthora cactorum]|nr:hypothetical protein PC120_g14462 [Phytophthora cactorum]KAG4051141.1 hypothetical protein PC123_g13629 [Phytophthora cactorum]
MTSSRPWNSPPPSVRITFTVIPYWRWDSGTNSSRDLVCGEALDANFRQGEQDVMKVVDGLTKGCEVLIKPRQPPRRGRSTTSVEDLVSRCSRPIGKLKEQGGPAITEDC